MAWQAGGTSRSQISVGFRGGDPSQQAAMAALCADISDDLCLGYSAVRLTVWVEQILRLIALCPFADLAAALGSNS